MDSAPTPPGGWPNGLTAKAPKSATRMSISQAAEGYVEQMFSGGKAALRPIYDALLKLGLESRARTSKACPCQTIVPLYRNHVFAQIKPTTRTRIDFGFALGDTKAKGRSDRHRRLCEERSHHASHRNHLAERHRRRSKALAESCVRSRCLEIPCEDGKSGSGLFQLSALTRRALRLRGERFVHKIHRKRRRVRGGRRREDEENRPLPKIRVC